MAHLRTPPPPSPGSKPYGLITPSTPIHLSQFPSKGQRCPDAPFLPANLFPFPQALRTSPRLKKNDPTKTDPIKPTLFSTNGRNRTRTLTDDHAALLQHGMPPTPAKTPVQQRLRQEETKRLLDEMHNNRKRDTTTRRLFPSKPTIVDDGVVVSVTGQTPSFEIYTDPTHRSPISSPNNPFELPTDNGKKGLSPRKRKYKEVQELSPHEMYYTFRGQKVVRKVAPGPKGQSWRESVKPVRLFQKEIEEEKARRRKKRRISMENIEEMDTEEDAASDFDNDEETMNC
jgi:hypothetical protein